MDYLQNHIWCHKSIWGQRYDCRHLVHFTRYVEHDTVDWENIIDEEADHIINDSNYRLAKKSFPDKEEHELVSMSSTTVLNLKPHVLDWLKNNIKDRNDKNSPQGWAVGSAQYRSTSPSEYTVFFHRKNDAMAFIREFSIHKKPVNYCQYFSDVRKELDVTTGKYTLL